ncbi:hypothetical protein OG470_31380 [Micromonospora sp. NBC_00389]|uniref:hypothetical protein n=1 Tax=Micromonospora sp. NBC_00389 TaxID=2903586 RepID=UPI002E1BFB9C
MNLRRIATTLVALVATLTASAVIASPAQAYSGPHYWMYTNDGNPGGRVDFWPDGDIVQVCDVQADGAHVNVVLHDIFTGAGYSVQASGNGNCTTRRASQGGSYDLNERSSSRGCYLFNIRLWDDIHYVSGSEDKAAWWNDNAAKRSDC